MRYDFDGIARGESWSRQFELKDSLSQPVDLTGRVATFLLRDNTGQRARLVSGVENADGSVIVTPADGLIVVTVKPSVTAQVTTASWALWIDENTDTADAAVWGTWQTVRVVTSDV